MAHERGQPAAVPPDLREKGRGTDGSPVFLDERLFVQITALTGCRDPAPLVAAMRTSGLRGALYANLCDPRGVALAVASKDPADFTGRVRDFLNAPPFADLQPDAALSMLGRTYALGYEPNLEHVLIRRPLERICNPAWPWAVWYPVRRAGAFERQPADEQRAMLMEHAALGAAWSAGGFAYDIRLACHGLGRDDNDFVVGLVGPDLHPLSAMVHAMRRTRQTSEFLEKLGPFIVGRAIWQSELP